MDALSLSRLRIGLFSQVVLQHETFDGATQTYQTTQDDIKNLFLLLADIQGQMDETSSFPMSAKAIFEYLTDQLSLYRPRAELIPMADVDGLLLHLQSYRLKTDELFVNIVTDTLAYDNGTVDLKTRINGLDTRLTADEAQIHVLAQSLAGSDILASESSLSSWLTTHARDMILDTAFRSSKFHEIKVTAAEWASDW